MLEQWSSGETTMAGGKGCTIGGEERKRSERGRRRGDGERWERKKMEEGKKKKEGERKGERREEGERQEESFRNCFGIKIFQSITFLLE